MGGGGCGRLWRIFSTILMVKPQQGGRKGFWVGGRVSEGDIFDLAGLSDDHLLSPNLLYNYGRQRIVLQSLISTTFGIAPLQLCSTVGLGQTAMISGQTWIGKDISVSLMSLSVL